MKCKQGSCLQGSWWHQPDSALCPKCCVSLLNFTLILCVFINMLYWLLFCMCAHVVAGMCGYFAGKLSYMKTCQQKFFNLENSPIGEALRQRHRHHQRPLQWIHTHTYKDSDVHILMRLCTFLLLMWDTLVKVVKTWRLNKLARNYTFSSVHDLSSLYVSIYLSLPPPPPTSLKVYRSSVGAQWGWEASVWGVSAWERLGAAIFPSWLQLQHRHHTLTSTPWPPHTWYTLKKSEFP